MFQFIVISALLSGAIADTEFKFPNGRIVGGESTSIQTYPYQISLQQLGKHSCGGAIISEYYVLTAGHCVGSLPLFMSIRAGSSIRGHGGSVHKVSQIIRHENYKTNAKGIPINDIALIRVSEPFKLDSTRRPIKLFNNNEVCTPGTRSIITGWGTTGGQSLPTQLQTVTIPIISRDICNEAYTKMGGLPNGQICAAYYGIGGKDACQGDSGGPLAVDGRLAGVVSWGNGCAQAFYPGVYTEVAYFRDWIRKHAQV